MWRCLFFWGRKFKGHPIVHFFCFQVKMNCKSKKVKAMDETNGVIILFVKQLRQNISQSCELF